MENDRNDLPEWLNNRDSDESDFSGYSSDEVDSDRAQSSGNDDSDRSGSESENEGGPAERWVVNDRTARPKSQFFGPVPGANAVLGPDENELDFFLLFFPAFLFELLVNQTNLYARQRQQTRPDAKWSPVTEEEIKAWLGMRVAMSILQLPQTAMYWSTDSLFGNLPLKKVMTRDRFDKISQYFHLNDSTQNLPRDNPGRDKIYHVRPVHDAVLDRCLTTYNAHQNVSIDEAMIKFRGRLAFRQYMPAKPTKYGIKVWMRSDPTNGYTNEFQIYTGKVDGRREVGLAERVVCDLSRRIWNRHHIVNVDNFFTSYDLFHRLLQNGTYARGTARTNRKKFPIQNLPKNAVKVQGQFRTAQRGEVTAVVWMDKKPVYALSTADDSATIETTVSRKSRNGEIKQVPCPTVITEYNGNMNGVDHADQLRTEYSTYRTSKKWWAYVFWFLFDVAVTNGFVLMKESPNHNRVTKNNRQKPRTMIEFRMNLAKLLIGDYKENDRAALATISNGHFPEKGEKRGRCRQCSKTQRRREVLNKCKECNIHLCTDCFEPYHRDLARNRR